MKTRSQPMLTPESNSSRGECSKAFRDIEARKKDRRVIVASSSDRYGAAIHGKERKGMRSNILEIARIGDLNGWYVSGCSDMHLVVWERRFGVLGVC
jgi:hypothetical protein